MPRDSGTPPSSRLHTPPNPSSVLYQRGVYHPDSFAREAKYGITTLVTTDEGLKKYLDNVIQQLKGKGTAVALVLFHTSGR